MYFITFHYVTETKMPLKQAGAMNGYITELVERYQGRYSASGDLYGSRTTGSKQPLHADWQ